MLWDAKRRCQRSSAALLKRRQAGASAVFILLRGAAADAAGALDDAILDDRYRTLAHDHVAAFGQGDTARRRLVGPFGQLAARPAERRRGNGLALAAIGARPD